MKLNTQNANNLMSRDFMVARSAALNVVNNKDLETFREICVKSEFIFDFLKEKILKNLIESVNENNCRNLFEFMEEYCNDFEDFIILGLVKCANEELTDIVLDLLENGTEVQKAYSAGYFNYVLDPVALDALKKYAFSEFEPLKINCAKALRAFGDREVYGAMFEKLSSEDEYEALDGIEFLVAYGDTQAFGAIYDYMKKTNYPFTVALDLLALKDFHTLIQEGRSIKAHEIYDVILSGYPEILPLSTIIDCGVKDIIKYLLNGSINSKSSKLILKTKIKFELINSSDNYTFDLDKKTKEEILEIVKLLNSFDAGFYEKCAAALEGEFDESDENIIDVLEIILELNLTQFAPIIAKKISLSKFPPLICEGAKTLKALERLDLVNEEELVQNLNEPNSIALLRSYYKE